MRRTFCTVFLLCLMVQFTACYNFGPARVPSARLGYNESVGRSANEQMLLNIVRLRYQHVPVFLQITSVLTQYTYAGQLGVEGETGSSLGFSLWSFGGDANVIYAERPTLTFTPLTGEQFAEHLLRPIIPGVLFSLVQSGWPPEQLLSMGLERLNHIQNLPFGRNPIPEHIEELRTFHRVVQMITELHRRQALEMQTDKTTEPPARRLILGPTTDPETQNLIDEFKSTLRLDPQRSVFQVTQRLAGRKPDEITIRVRSMLALMGYVAQGVEVPGLHIKEERAMKLVARGDDEALAVLFPLHVYSQPEEPEEAFVRVRFQDHWFYLKHSDHRSKRAFGLLTYLFQLQAPTPDTTGPMLTLPVGG